MSIEKIKLLRLEGKELEAVTAERDLLVKLIEEWCEEMEECEFDISVLDTKYARDVLSMMEAIR